MCLCVLCVPGDGGYDGGGDGSDDGGVGYDGNFHE